MLQRLLEDGITRSGSQFISLSIWVNLKL